MKTINTILILSLLVITFSCEDILEKDITNDIVQIISPLNNSTIESNVANFKWNKLDGADKYRIQVYNENELMILDSLVNQTNLTYTLSTGSYRWRVRGENFGYVSPYTLEMNFKLNQTDDLTNQQVLLSIPSNNIYSNSSNLILSWQSINAADYYELEILNITNGQSIAYQQSNIDNTSVSLNSSILNQDAAYQWKVRAVNSTSKTQYTSRNFYFDTVVPNQPQNNLPTDNTKQTANQLMTFSWTSQTDSGTYQSPLTYTIEFANNSSFSSIILSENTTTTSFQNTFTAIGDYYWRIKTSDLAGNNSNYSTTFKFTLN